MNEKEIQQRLGIPPGSTLTALVALAENVAPDSPWNAFKLIWLLLPWLQPGRTAAELRHGTPRNVHPFAETGGDLNHFGFLMDGDLPTDERPIVYVVPKDDDDATQIVAPNLREFLGLVAIAFGEVISRTATDAEWTGVREQWYADDPARLQEMARLSNLLCSIPGVARPASPSRVANAYPDQVFALVFEDENEDTHDAPADARMADFKHNLRDAHDATVLAQRALEDERYDEAIHHAHNGMQHPAHRPRCLAVLVTSFQRSGQKAAAKRAANELLDAWLDPAPIPPPGVHPRKAIDREELISLLDLIEGAHAAPMIQRVRSALDLEEPSGDFL